MFHAFPVVDKLYLWPLRVLLHALFQCNDSLSAPSTPPLSLSLSPGYVAIYIGSMYGIYIYMLLCANIWGILMVNVTIYNYSIHGSYGIYIKPNYI